MRKRFTKLLCLTVASITALGLISASACSNVYRSKSLNYTSTSDVAESNGGFAVGKGDYIYFINGKQDYSADNTYGNVVRGAVMRISKEDLANRNYSSVDTVVPQIAYSGNSNAGLFIYGDYIYYATPSTEKNSDGEVQNSYLAFKSTKLDGTESMKGYYTQYSDNSIEYRYVKAEDGDIYLVYVATSEDLYGTSCTNIHSVNTRTNVDTLLAYNVDSVAFDKSDVTNPRIYYTMKVPNLSSTSSSTFSSYNQIYTVTADTVIPNEYDFSEVEDYDAETDPIYVNCGMLVLDGIGKFEGNAENITQFNGVGADKVDRDPYTYTITSYENGNLFYTRTDKQSSADKLFDAKESDILSDNWDPITSNGNSFLVRDGSSASTYTYLFGGEKGDELQKVLIASSDGLVRTVVNDGVISDKIDNDETFYLTDGSATVLFVDGNYLYYSLSGGNGYTVYRMRWDGQYTDYNNYPVEEYVNDYTPVRILDLDCASDWYKPEMFDGQLLFATQTLNMTEYPYIMACDLRSREGDNEGEVMTNAQIDELNEKYEGISDDISDIDETTYENLQNALRYAFYTNDADYIDVLIKAYVDILDYEEEHFWSEQSLKKYKEFVLASETGEWSEYSDTIKINNTDIASNKRDYYYSLLGKMTDEDTESYLDLLRTTYLQAYPEKEEGPSWYDELSTGAKAGFIIGVCAGGLIIIGAVTLLTLHLIKKRKKALPVYKKKRIKVDTTDDKDIDVYSE